jgi:uncharacterized membrane protein YphA (DoxX/SURF4 family)
MSIVVTIVLLHLGLLFAVAGVSKALSITLFTHQIEAHDIIPAALRIPLVYFIVTFEIVLGIWLMTGLFYRLAAGLAVALLSSFLLYHALLRRVGSGTECGCMGEPSQRDSTIASPAGILLNALAALTLAVLGSDQRHVYGWRFAVAMTGAALALRLFISWRNVAVKRLLEARVVDSMQVATTSSRSGGP